MAQVQQLTHEQELKLPRQIRSEEEMRGMGVAKFRQEIQKAQENGMESNTSGVLKIMTMGFDPLLAAVKDWKAKCANGQAVKLAKGVGKGKSGGGSTSVAYTCLKDIDDDQLAFLTLKTVLDTISKARTLADVTLSIGRNINTEINFREFKKASPNNYKKIKDDVTKKTKDAKHIATVLKRSAKLDDHDIELSSYSVTERHHIGSALLSLLIDSTGLVEIYTPPMIQGKKRKPAILQPTEKTTEWLNSYNARCELLSPVVLPCIIPPKDWTSPYSGGFWSEYIKVPLVRKGQFSYLDEMENMDMWEIYQGVNHLQKTPWVINTKVMEVMRHCADHNLPIGNLPAGQETPLPPKPLDIETNKDARWLWRKQAAAIYGENVRSRSKYIGLQKKLQVAERFSVEEELYFVYSFDFRGRVYPVQIHLNPQGDDTSKALLKFAEGKPVDDETGAWLALHGANLFGFDKVSLQDRVTWTLNNTDKICECAHDPYTNRWWAEADKPWQFLAFCFEWNELQTDPDNFVSHLPVALDGSCNGLQNFSAMLRDEIGGKATNLTPNEKPNDIYQQVADLVAAKLEYDIKNGVKISTGKDKDGNEYTPLDPAVWSGFVVRKLVKQPTMTMPYGATLTGYREQIQSVVQEWKDEGKPYPELQNGGFAECMYMAKLIDSSLGEVVVAAKKAMDWLQNVAEVIAQESLPIYWMTPVGFPVLQNYRDVIVKQVKTEIAGRFYNLKVSTGNSTKINKRKMKAAIAPNFVHSCDSAHLMRTVNLCDSNQITSLQMIHDSYATHAADTPTLREILRHAFVQIHEKEPLESFYEAMKKQSSTPNRIPAPPAKGSLDLLKVLEADFFFA